MEISELYQIYQEHPVITTDSRDCPEGSIFLALKGASFDGNKFADMALEKGCAYVIIDEKESAKEGDERYILVEDCLTTFKELARASPPLQHTSGGHHWHQWQDDNQGIGFCRVKREIQRDVHPGQLQ
jgi:hypothetical protein